MKDNFNLDERESRLNRMMYDRPLNGAEIAELTAIAAVKAGLEARSNQISDDQPVANSTEGDR